MTTTTATEDGKIYDFVDKSKENKLKQKRKYEY